MSNTQKAGSASSKHTPQNTQKEFLHHSRNHLPKDTHEVATYVKQMAMSGDMNAAKLYFDFALTLSKQQAEEAGNEPLHITDEQAKDILSLLKKEKP